MAVKDFREAWSIACEIPGMYSPRELQCLFLHASGVVSNGRMLEIGCEQGRSSTVIALASDAELTLVDPFVEHGPEGAARMKNNFLNNMEFLVEQYGRTHVYINKKSEYLEEGDDGDIPGLFDFIHIDGNHSYENVVWDFTLVVRKLSPNGKAIFHDYARDTIPSVTEALEDCLIQHRLRLEDCVETCAVISR